VAWYGFAGYSGDGTAAAVPTTATSGGDGGSLTQNGEKERVPSFGGANGANGVKDTTTTTTGNNVGAPVSAR